MEYLMLYAAGCVITAFVVTYVKFSHRLHCVDLDDSAEVVFYSILWPLAALVCVAFWLGTLPAKILNVAVVRLQKLKGCKDEEN